MKFRYVHFQSVPKQWFIKASAYFLSELVTMNNLTPRLFNSVSHLRVPLQSSKYRLGSRKISGKYLHEALSPATRDLMKTIVLHSYQPRSQAPPKLKINARKISRLIFLYHCALVSVVDPLLDSIRLSIQVINSAYALIKDISK